MPSQHAQHAVKQALYHWQRSGLDQEPGIVLLDFTAIRALWLAPQLLREVTPLHGRQDALRRCPRQRQQLRQHVAIQGAQAALCTAQEPDELDSAHE